MSPSTILRHLFRRLWWGIVGSPGYRTEESRRASRDHVPLEALRKYETRDEARIQRRDGHVVELRPRGAYRAEFGGRGKP